MRSASTPPQAPPFRPSRKTVTYARPALAALLGILTWANTLAYIDGTPRLVGIACIAITLATPSVLALMHVLAGRPIPRGLTTALLSLTVLCCLMAPRGGLSEGSITPFLQALLVTGFFAGASTFVWPDASLRLLSLFAGAWCLAMTAMWVVSECPTPFLGYCQNPNATGGLLFSMVAVSQLAPTRRLSFSWFVLMASLACGALLCIATVARAALLALFASLVIYSLWPWLTRRRRTHRAVFGAAVVCIAGFVTASTLVLERLQDRGLTDISGDLTGKRLGSRELVWNTILEEIGYRPLLGHGPGLTPADVLGVDLSAHCLYLQIGLAAGLVGVAGLFVCLAMVWDRLWDRRQDHVARVAGATLIGVLVHQTFEVALVQNHMAIGASAWIVIAVGMSRSVKRPMRASQPSRRRSYGTLGEQQRCELPC